MTNTKDIKHSKYWYEYDRNDSSRQNPFKPSTKCYAVMGGVDWEGHCIESLLLFDSKADAEAYAEEIMDNYDYVTIKIKEVIESSLLKA